MAPNSELPCDDDFYKNLTGDEQKKHDEVMKLPNLNAPATPGVARFDPFLHHESLLTHLVYQSKEIGRSPPSTRAKKNKRTKLLTILSVPDLV